MGYSEYTDVATRVIIRQVRNVASMYRLNILGMIIMSIGILIFIGIPLAMIIKKIQKAVTRKVCYIVIICITVSQIVCTIWVSSIYGGYNEITKNDSINTYQVVNTAVIDKAKCKELWFNDYRVKIRGIEEWIVVTQGDYNSIKTGDNVMTVYSTIPIRDSAIDNTKEYCGRIVKGTFKGEKIKSHNFR